MERCQARAEKAKTILASVDPVIRAALDEVESCGMIGHSVRRPVELVFADGSTRAGLVYPWEGDYSGSPWYLATGKDHQECIWVGAGEEVVGVKDLAFDQGVIT